MAELTYRGTDIRTANIHFDIVRGFFEPADVRGFDTVVPGKAGRNARNRVRDRRMIELRGYVHNAAGTAWHASTDTLMGLCAGTSAAGTLSVIAPYLGQASGTVSILARVVRVTAGPVVGQRFQTWSIELEAVGDPPDWA